MSARRTEAPKQERAHEPKPETFTEGNGLKQSQTEEEEAIKVASLPRSILITLSECATSAIAKDREEVGSGKLEEEAEEGGGEEEEESRRDEMEAAMARVDETAKKLAAMAEEFQAVALLFQEERRALIAGSDELGVQLQKMTDINGILLKENTELLRDYTRNQDQSREQMKLVTEDSVRQRKQFKKRSEVMQNRIRYLEMELKEALAKAS